MLKEILKKDIFIITTLYSFAYGLILLNKGLFWDDWVLFGMDNEIVMEMFREIGKTPIGYFHNFLLSFENGILFYRALVFLAFLFSGLLLNSILKTIRKINDTSRIFIVLFFVLFPVNCSRIALITAPYAMCYFMFFLGFWLISQYLRNKKNIYKIISIPLFAVSFSTNSLLFYFFFTVLIYILYFEIRNLKSFRSTCQTCLRYIDLLLLPFLFWVIKKLFFTPYGLYKNYNTIEFQHLSYSGVLQGFQHSFLDVFKESFLLFPSQSLTILILSFSLFLILKNRSLISKTTKADYFFVLYGPVLFIVGILPYLLVGRSPSLYDWDSRHQLLVPLGAALLITYSSKIFLNELKINNELQVFVYSSIIMLFVMCDFNAYLAYQKDWYKQLSLIENIKESEIIKDNTTFLFHDKTNKLDAKGRNYRFYEYTGIMKYTFDDETRFGVDIVAFNKRGLQYYNKFFSDARNLKDYKQSEPQYKIMIDYGSYNLTKKRVLMLMLYSFFNPNEFDKNIKQIINIEYIKL